MKDIKKIEFHNPPTPQHEAVVEEKKAQEEAERKADEVAKKEAEIQPVIEKEIEEVITPKMTLREWIELIAFWGMAVYIFATSIAPLWKKVTYAFTQSENIQFAEKNPDMITAIRLMQTDFYNIADEQIYDTVCGTTNQYCIYREPKKVVVPTPTNTPFPTPVVKQ
jgi:hypothetical protein